jgi:hypothetical protein
MGNKHPVSLSCEIEQYRYEAGDTMRGCVHLTVAGRPVTSFQGITVTLAGVEYVVAVREEDDSTFLDRSLNTRIKIHQVVTKFEDGLISPGQYDFPFELSLPEEVSADQVMTTSAENDDSESLSYSAQSASSHIEVTYKLRAHLKRKPKVPLNIDTDIWSDAVCQTQETIAQ